MTLIVSPGAPPVESPTRKILVDVDGVLANFVQDVLDMVDRFRLRDGLPPHLIAHNDVPSWEMFSIPELAPYEDEAWRHMDRPGWASRLAPYPRTIEAMKTLRALGRVRILTAPIWGPTFCFDRAHWLYDHYGVKRGEIIYAKEKADYGGHVFIDDKVENVRDWIGVHGARGSIAILWAQPWNETEEGHPRVFRTRSWAEVVKLIEHHHPLHV